MAIVIWDLNAMDRAYRALGFTPQKDDPHWQQFIAEWEKNQFFRNCIRLKLNAVKNEMRDIALTNFGTEICESLGLPSER